MNTRTRVVGFLLSLSLALSACTGSGIGDACEKDDDCGAATPANGSAEVKLICLRAIQGSAAPSGTRAYSPDAGGAAAVVRYCAIPCDSDGSECGAGLMQFGRCWTSDLDGRRFCTNQSVDD